MTLFRVISKECVESIYWHILKKQSTEATALTPYFSPLVRLNKSSSPA